VKDDLVLPPFSFLVQLSSSVLAFQVCLSLSKNVRYLSSQSFRLEPAAIRQRRIVGSRGREVPLLVGSVEPIAVPGSQSVKQRL
jgi:hypothetical protein